MNARRFVNGSVSSQSSCIKASSPKSSTLPINGVCSFNGQLYVKTRRIPSKRAEESMFSKHCRTGSPLISSNLRIFCNRNNQQASSKRLVKVFPTR